MGKIGRNEKCPCGSGKKFKKCHLGAEDEEIFTGKRQIHKLNKFISKSKVKECIFHDKKTCTGKIIKAHSIQNNGVLSKIAEAGHVLMPVPEIAKFDSEQIMMPVHLKKVGRNEATTFTGFCKRHDNEIFTEIDKKAYKKDKKQNFLLAYRTFAKEYYAKREALSMLQQTFAAYPKKSIAVDFHERALQGNELSVQDNEIDKYKFDKAFMNETYDILHTEIFLFNQNIEFSVSSCFELDADLEGTYIYDRYDFNPAHKPPKLFLNIFPEHEESYIILSCFKDEYQKYYDFFEQLREVYNNNLVLFKQLMTNLVGKYCENLVLSPRLTENWGRKKTDEFLLYWNLTALEQATPEKFPINSLTVDNHFNLFDIKS